MATWNAFGSHEPDNGLDDPAFMWSDPAPAGVQRIYFNAFATVYGVGNPNVAALKTHNEAATLEYNNAMLGVWIDCNGDGYVGLAESAVLEYSSSLLLDDSVCPPHASASPNTWVPGQHNYANWVTELVPIAGVTSDASDDTLDARVYRDAEAMVWGDFGRPTDGADAGGTCALTPFPRGTMQSTGGIINYASCISGATARWNEVFLGRNVAGQPIPGVESVTGPTGLVFPDPSDARGSWADVATFGTEDSSQSAARIIDCSADPLLNVGETINGTGVGGELYTLDNDNVGTGIWDIDVTSVDPQPGSGTPTVPATYNETNEELFDDCDTSNDAGHDFYGGLLNEGDFNGVSTARKTEADWNLQYSDSQRGRPMGNLSGWPAVFRAGAGGSDPWAGAFPQRMGASLILANATSMWESSSVLVKRGPSALRTNLAAENPVTIAPAYYLTFYAHVGSATTNFAALTLPSGRGEYGAAQCGENENGIHNGWECDGTQWYFNADGTPYPEPYPTARPGQGYEFRDTDCYDGGDDVQGQNVAIGAPAYGDNPCTPAN